MQISLKDYPNREILYWLQGGDVKFICFRWRHETEAWIYSNMATSAVVPDCRFYLLNNRNEWWESLSFQAATQTRRDKYYYCKNLDWLPNQIRMLHLLYQE